MPKEDTKFTILLGISTIFLIWVGRWIIEGLGYKDWFVQAIFASLLALIPTTGSVIKQKQTQKARRKRVEKQIAQTLTFVRSFVRQIKVDQQSIVSSIVKHRSELVLDATYDPFTIARSVFRYLGITEDNLCEYLGVLTLCYYVKKRKASPIHTIVQNYVSARGLVNPRQEEGRTFLTLYNRIFIKGEKINKIQEVNKLSRPISSQELTKTARVFLNAFAKSSIFWYFQEKLHKSEELRQTLITLFREGKLPALHIEKKALESMEKTLSEKGVRGQTYLVIVNESGRRRETTRFKDIFRYIPHIGAVGRATRLPGYKKSHCFALYLVKLNRNYPNLQDFIRTEIESRVGGGAEYQGVVAIYKLNVAESITTTIPRGVKLRSDFLKRGRQILELLRSGEMIQLDPIDIVSSSEISYEEIMSVLPFNLLATKITDSERIYLVKNYDLVKRHFNVDKITDWRNVDPKMLSRFLLSIGKPAYDKIELKSLFHINSIKELDESKLSKRFFNIARSIVEQANNYYESLSPLLP